MSDGFKNFVSNPLKDAAVGSAVDGLGDAFNQIGEAANDEPEEDEEEGGGLVGQAAQFVFDNFFSEEG